uniref:Uncharacterized protein n=1 Tax=Triticum urartu TaxID=4572 RepID=A0A8R7R1P6_TRIUA
QPTVYLIRSPPSTAEEERVRGGAALSNFCLHTTYAPSSVRVVGGGYRAPEVASTPWACSCWSSSWQVPDARVRAPATSHEQRGSATLTTPGCESFCLPAYPWSF